MLRAKHVSIADDYEDINLEIYTAKMSIPLPKQAEPSCDGSTEPPRPYGQTP